MSKQTISRRDALKLAGAPLAASFGVIERTRSRQPKKVIIAGAGIAGLSCAYELMRRGHDVVVLEASSRTGGHVLTVRAGLADGLYADGGAEHFTKPGYDIYWRYVKEFNLPALYYPRREHMIRFINGKMYTEEMLADGNVLKRFGFNQRETDFLEKHQWWELPLLYFTPYMDHFKDEYSPFDAGLNHLDRMTVTDLLKKDGASGAAIRRMGGSRSALQAVWHAAILKLRAVPMWPPKVYRIQGGNQKMTDAFAARLGRRVQLNRPVTAVRHGSAGVTVHYRESSRTKKIEADYLVCCLSAVMLQWIPFTPALPQAKAYAIRNVPYYFDTRVIFQARTPFWQKDGLSPNMEFSNAALQHIWRTAEEVPTSRALLVGTASGAGSAEDALAALRKFYPGKSIDIERTQVVSWPLEKWCSACERVDYKPGELPKFWPVIIQPHGRIHFAGAYADNLNWGMEAATRSANRVAKEIDAA
ncbi:MAG TPA: FAD-dependent oxidoreductase [Acidobacteriota bacterium]|nr:FAD-dependent oxidoreductase [Acidobacteriota bacterium]